MSTMADRLKAIRDRRNKNAELERQMPKAKMAMMDVQALWTDLQAGMQIIFAPADKRQAIPQTRYMQLYSNVYNYCCNASELAKGGSRGTRSGDYEGGVLYERLTYFLRAHLHKIVQEKPAFSSEVNILQFYVDAYDDYSFSVRVLTGVFSHLNRHWVPVRKQSDPNVLETYPLALSCWKNTLFRDLNQSVTNAILRLITNDRKGETVNGHLIETVIASYIELGTIDSFYTKVQTGSNNLAVYVQHFEKTFLEETTEFYAAESKIFLTENSVPNYMKKVEQRLVEEERRVSKFLHRTTLPKLIHNCEQVLIKPHLGIFYSQFGGLLKDNQGDDLRRLYNLVNRLNLEYTSQMSTEFEAHVMTFAKTSLLELPLTDQNDPKLPEEFFNKIFEVYDQYDELVKTAFVSDMRFRKALDNACTDFVNKNSVTTKFGQHKSAFLLAKYSDRLLRSSGKNKCIGEDDMEKKMDGLMAIFKFLADKDVFQKHYSYYLASRLISGTSASDEWERSLIAKMKNLYGQAYTAKMQRMFLDIESTRLLSGEFKEWMGEFADMNLPYNFFIHVLTSGSWNYTSQNEEFILPEQLEIGRTNFTAFYNTKHNGRKLCWLAGRSHGELKFNATEKKSFHFVASTYQMAILLMFNSTEQVKVSDMIETTKLKLEIVEQVLQSLTKQNILKADEPFTVDSVVTLNNKFNNKHCRIHINVPLRTEAKTEAERVDKDVIRSREIVLQATVVRIMKARKTSTNQELQSEVINQVKASFTPEIRMIRLAIEKSIAEEYILRDPNDKDKFTYIS